MALFHRYAYICKPLGGGDWFSPEQTWALTDSEILKAVAGAHQKYLIGCRPGRATKYAVLDIDAGSKYHNVAAVDALRSLLKQAGLEKTMAYRSSFSEGWHLYIFFEEAISSQDLSRQLNQLLKLSDFEIKKGTLEIFPQPGVGSNGQGLRLPLQEGFAWLDQKTLEVENERFEYSPTVALELFIDALNGCANTRHQFHQFKAYVAQLTPHAVENSADGDKATTTNVVPIRGQAADNNAPPRVEIRRVFQVVPPGINAESWVKGREYYNAGLTGPSQRADAIFCMGHYLFYGDPESHLPALGYGLEQERKKVIETILSESHHGNSKELNRDRADAIKQVDRATAWVPPSRRIGENPKSAFEMPISWVRHNANLKNQTRSRIATAINQFLDEGKAFSTRDLSQRSNCSRTTLYKHQDLWKSAYEVLQHRLLASGPHEYNAVGASVSLETADLYSPDLQNEGFNQLFESEQAVIDDLSYRRKSKAVQKWIEPIQRIFPSDLSECESPRLLFLIPTFSWFVSTAPTPVCKNWLSGQIARIRFVLQQRALDFRLVGEWQNALSTPRMFNRYLLAGWKNGFLVARKLATASNRNGVGKHPPPA